MNPLSSQTSQVALQALLQCPLCKANERRRLFPVPVHQNASVSGQTITLYECKNCGLRYFDPCLTPEGMGAIYESSEDLSQRCSAHQTYYEYGDLNSETKTARDYTRGVMLLEKENKPGSLFEVGYGSGLFLAIAKARGWQVDGIDTSRQNQSLARDKFKIDLKQGDFNAQAGLENRFDAVAAWDVLEHQSDPNAFLTRMHSLLKPGGRILIAVPNDPSFLRYLSCALYDLSFGKLDQGVRKIYVLEHIVYYSHVTLRRILEQNQFKVETHFFSSTDLERYHFSSMEKLTASAILIAGKLFQLENRLIMTARKI